MEHVTTDLARDATKGQKKEAKQLARLPEIHILYTYCIYIL